MKFSKVSADLVTAATVLAMTMVAGCTGDMDGRDADVVAPTQAAGSGNHGSHIANHQLTFYWVTNHEDYPGSHNTAIKTASCSTIAMVSSGFASALKLEGTGKLPDGRIVNYHKSCGCSSYGCYVVAGDEYPWGIGVQSRPLHPMRSIAVDKSFIAYGEWVYAPELDGYEVPDGPWGSFVHDGCLKAEDTGSAINGWHIDFFVGYKSAYQQMVGDLGSKTQLYRGGTKCTDDTVDMDGGGGGGGDGAAGDDGGDDGDDGAAGDDGADDLTGKACFPGADGSGNTCLDVVSLPAGTSGYNYPSPLSGQANYRAPIAYLDLEAHDSSTKLAPNFTLGELAQTYKGRYAVVQPHAVEGLQNFRNTLGAIRVNSGYRNPAYNSSVGGATHSRHMYGDAFDLKPLSTSLSKLENACTANGGKLVEYNSHVHCDFRFDPVDPTFFGIASMAQPDPMPGPDFGAAIEEDDGTFTVVDLQGFDEGEPVLRWTALDGNGDVVEEHRGPAFVAPPGTATVRVLVGARVEVEHELGLTAG